MNLSLSAAVQNRHTIINSASAGIDKYGKFPVNCPNGSYYSVRLGNEMDGAEVERISYTFTVPLNRDSYSIIFNYAIVFSNTATESAVEKPAFTAKVVDVSENKYIECSSFEFVPEPNGSNSFQSNSRFDVLFKPWSAASIDLAGYAGKTLRLEFTTRDCYYADNGNGHFCYAYLDINDFCGPPVRGTAFCDPNSLTLIAPFGFKNYEWYNEDMSSLIGTGNKLTIQPAPSVNTRFALKIVPFDNSGCAAILYPMIVQGEGVTGFAFPDVVQACAEASVDLTDAAHIAGNKPGLTYTFFTDAAASTYLQNPNEVTVPGTYFVKASNETGCFEIKPVDVVFTKVDLQVNNPPIAYFPYAVDITTAFVTSGSSTGLTFTYWLDAEATISLPLPSAITKSGTYYIKGSTGNCFETKEVVVIVKNTFPNTFTPNGDGINDVFHTLNVAGIGTDFFKIYNRWGRVVFDSRKDGSFWDGTIDSKKQPAGTYYWQWNAMDESSKSKIERSGQIILIR